jgi:hypothetical protein
MSQKRPIYVSKETYKYLKRDLHISKERGVGDGSSVWQLVLFVQVHANETYI